MRRHVLFALGAGAAMAMAIACKRAPSGGGPTASPPDVDPLLYLRAFEKAKRAQARFLEMPAQDRAFGPDPYDLATLRDGRFAGILRGEDAVVILDSELNEVTRAPAPRSPSGVTVYGGAPAGDLRPGDVLVASEIEPVVAHYRPVGSTIERLADVSLGREVLHGGESLGVRDIATGPEGVAYVVEEHDDRLITLRFSKKGIERHERSLPRGPLRLARTRHGLFVASLIAHEITAYTVDRQGLPIDPPAIATLDGPYWGLDAIDVGEDVLLIAGGAEDRPLDRRGDFFGYIDSFVYAYRWTARPAKLERTTTINVSEHGLIVPKAMAFDRSRGAPLSALVTSYGAPKAVRLVWSGGMDSPPEVTSLAAPPGVSAIVSVGAERGVSTSFVAADPLLDAWVRIDEHGASRIRPASSASPGRDGRTDRERLGEALFFTDLMAPSSSSEGAKSRFSCETCHFEGYVDGRVHHTGRGDVHATTKPLVGLFNNRPHFSRALDPDLSAVAENEFRVAGAPSPTDPHFDIEVRDVPWLRDLGITPRHYDAAELRLSLMSFLMSFTHRTNPRATHIRAFSTEERTGAIAFRDHCERCHQARASADDPTSRLPFERWEALVLGGNDPIVWASDAYEKTGIEPYVHERGARVPSLRRLYKKRPYFTNGSAADLSAVLERARFHQGSFAHDGGSKSDEKLDRARIDALKLFLDLL